MRIPLGLILRCLKFDLTTLQLILAALVHGGLLLLTSVCESSSPIFSILVPRKCDNFNQNFFGDPALTFSAGCHCLLLAALVSSLFAVKMFQLTCKKLQKWIFDLIIISFCDNIGLLVKEMTPWLFSLRMWQVTMRLCNYGYINIQCRQNRLEHKQIEIY